MRRLLPLLTLPLLLAACAGHSRLPEQPPTVASALAPPRLPADVQAPVILVSIDGFRNDYTDRGLTPTLQRLIDTGTRARAMRPSYPSITFPNHYTLVTGLRPDHHGVIANFMRDPQIPGVMFSMFDRDTVGDARWWNDGKPLWTSVREAGGRAAAMFWVGSEAPVHGAKPEYWRPFDISVQPAQRVEQVLTWLDLPTDQRPHFITLYFDTVDTAGHLHGPDAVQTNAAIAQVDGALGQLLAGLEQRGLAGKVNLVVTSDHGMLATTPEHEIYLDDYIDASQIELTWTGAYAAFNPLPGGEAEAAKLLGQHEHFQCMTADQIPARFAYGSHRRVPRYHCPAAPGWQLTTREALKRKGHRLYGEHGYDNQLAQMQSPFIAWGPAFKPGHEIAAIDNVDVYPLLAHLVGVAPAANDGALERTADALRQSTSNREATP
jgi:predicted AlkP superfamily pyrophosphatase or phosphodiesterase